MTNDLEQLRGEVERLVYISEESGFTICRLAVPGKADLVTVAGNMPGVQPGERLQLWGRWINHPVHGYQFRADSYSSQLPASVNAVRRYLASSLVKGIGPVLAGRLVDCFGDETLRVIDEQPERLAEVSGVGPRRVESIMRAWEEQQEIRGVMLFLQGHGVSAAYSTRIYRTYGQDAVTVVQENPYRLAQDVRGIGFLTADKIARQMGIDEHSPHRAQAALEHLLLERADEGHVFTPNAELVEMCQSRYDLPEALLSVSVGSLRKSGRIVLDGETVFLRGLYLAERGVAGSIGTLAASPGHRREFDAATAVDWASRRMGVELTGEQRQAVHEAVTQKVFVLTGGPGTGKTTILRAVISVLEALGQRVILAAPTGRAAKRLGEATGREAQTLHRLLEFKPGEGRYGRNAERPLETDAVAGRLQSRARWITKRGRRERGVCGYGCCGISIPVLGAGAGPPEGQGSAPSLSSHTAFDSAGLGLRSDHYGPHRVVRQDALACAEGAAGLSQGPSSPRYHHLPHPGWGAL